MREAVAKLGKAEDMGLLEAAAEVAAFLEVHMVPYAGI
jgi:hypothetical protein